MKRISFLEGFKGFTAKGIVMDMLGSIFVAAFTAIVEAVPTGPSEMDRVPEIRDALKSK